MYATTAIVALLAGSVAALPSGAAPQKAKSCSAKSADIHAWKVKAFDYHASYIFTTPAHQNSWGYASFNLTNPALPYTVTCSASSSQLEDFFYGTQNYDCTVPKGHGGDSATFSYSRPSGQLNINQTWTCGDNKARYTAQGGIKLNLHCKDKTTQNPEWQIGQIYSDREVTCNKVDVDAPITQISGVLRKMA